MAKLEPQTRKRHARSSPLQRHRSFIYLAVRSLEQTWWRRSQTHGTGRGSKPARRARASPPPSLHRRRLHRDGSVPGAALMLAYAASLAPRLLRPRAPLPCRRPPPLPSSAAATTTRRRVMATAGDGGKPARHRAAMDDVDKGAFKRKESVFRSALSTDGSTPFHASPGRYTLYISLACPWASRCYMVLSMKGLLDAVPVVVVHHFMGENGWAFVREGDADVPPMCAPEPHGFASIRDLYFKADPEYAARFTVPVLWDTQTETIVNNESSELIVMLHDFAAELGADPGAASAIDLYPRAQRKEIDDVAQSFYNGLNNGVYRCGFATTQAAYDEAFRDLFETMDALEARLGASRYLVGDKLTLADIRLFVTLIRFDAVYVLHFKTNKKRVYDYPNLLGYTRELYQMPAIRKTVNFEHIKKHYFRSHPTINPHRIVPNGPDLSFLDDPHGRT